MEDCRCFEELISASVDGELTAEEERALQAHLQSCESCRLYHQALLSLRDTAALPAPPPDLTARVMGAVHAAAPKKKAKIFPFPRQIRAVAAAAAVVALAVWAGARSLPRENAAVESAPAKQEMRMSVAAAPQAAPAAGAEYGTYGTYNAAMESAEEEFALYDAAIIPLTLRASDGEEHALMDDAALRLLGGETAKSAPDRAPDYTVLDENGALLWELWEDGDEILFRAAGETTLFAADAAALRDALGLAPDA